MNRFKKGTDEYGLLLGLIFAGCGALILWIGFWKTLLLVALFAIGYIIGGNKDLSRITKSTVEKIVPRKEETVDFRAEIEKRQAESMGQSQVDHKTLDD